MASISSKKAVALTVLLASGVVATTIGALALRGEVAAGAASDPASPELQAELLEHGFAYESPTSEDESEAQISPEDASASAMRNYADDPAGEGATSDVYLGRVTNLDREPVEEDRLAYLVQITGLDVYPMGGLQLDEAGNPLTPGASKVPAERVHHEVIVFIDARTDEEIVGTTFR